MTREGSDCLPIHYSNGEYKTLNLLSANDNVEAFALAA